MKRKIRANVCEDCKTNKKDLVVITNFVGHMAIVCKSCYAEHGYWTNGGWEVIHRFDDKNELEIEYDDSEDIRIRNNIIKSIIFFVISISIIGYLIISMVLEGELGGAILFAIFSMPVIFFAYLFWGLLLDGLDSGS